MDTLGGIRPDAGRPDEIDELRQQLERRNDLAANIIHELKTPLSIVLGLVARMLDTPGLLPATRRDAERIRANTLIALKHVADLLQAAQLESEATELHPRAVDVALLVRRVGATFESLAHERDIRLVVEADNPVLSRVDDDKLTTVVSNLVANALKFTPAGGRVAVTVQVGDVLSLTVADSGPGVPAHLREDVFERFRQVQGGAGRQYGASGLGLAIVRELVELHGGTVVLDDAPEGGAKFTVRLPRSEVAPDEIEREDLIDPTSREQPTLELLRSELAAQDMYRMATGAAVRKPGGLPEILVVEDNADLAAFLRELLAPMYEATVVADGAQAMELIEAQVPDLILTDLIVPEVSGTELITKVRARPELDEVPIVVLSARAEEDLRLRLLSKGVQDYVLKPFASAELLARIGNLVSRRHAEFARRQAESRFRGAFDNAPIGMALTSLEGVYAKVNRAFCAITGYTEGELVGRRFSDITHPDDVELHSDAMQAVIAGHHPANQIEKRYLRADGSVAWAAVSTSLLRGGGGEDSNLILQVEDISERKRLERELSRLVDGEIDHDPLTGLLTRHGFRELLRAQVERCQRYGETAALCRVDIDDFVQINKQHGREAGDAVLVAVADALRSRVRGSDLVGRLEGDEFAVLAVHVDDEGVDVMRDAVAETVAGIALPRNGHVLQVAANVGSTLVDGRHSADAVLLAADPLTAHSR